MKMYYRKAKPISYDSKRTRNKKTIKYIVIHYTAGTKDTAKNEVDYFATNNPRTAGAHFFVDQAGLIGRSIPMNRTAWSVGGSRLNTGGGNLYGIVTNSNSVSIELCAIAGKEPSDEMIKSVIKLIRYIRKYCPNVEGLVRHYDVTGKLCPATMVKSEAWNKFRERIGWVQYMA